MPTEGCTPQAEDTVLCSFSPPHGHLAQVLEQLVAGEPESALHELLGADLSDALLNRVRLEGKVGDKEAEIDPDGDQLKLKLAAVFRGELQIASGQEFPDLGSLQ